MEDIKFDYLFDRSHDIREINLFSYPYKSSFTFVFFERALKNYEFKVIRDEPIGKNLS